MFKVKATSIPKRQYIKKVKVDNMNITSISKPENSDGSPYADLGYNYLWELVNLGEFVPAFVGMSIFKDGFAKECYSGGFNGVQSRIINTLADMERSFSLERGVLIGRLHFAKLGTFERHYQPSNFSILDISNFGLLVYSKI